MKLLLIASSLIIFTVSEDPCEPWPGGVQSLQNCCNPPRRFSCAAEVSCTQRCAVKNPSINLNSQATSKDDVQKLKTCIEECFAIRSILFNPDGSMNKTMAMRLYVDDMRDPIWLRPINISVESCDFNSNGSLSENLSEFFNCVDEKLIKNCPALAFDDYNEQCQDIIEHAQKCRGVEPQCTAVTSPMAYAEYCCTGVPQLFQQQSYVKCLEKYVQTDYFRHLLVPKVVQCDTDDAGIKKDGKYDFGGIKKALLENSNKTVDWSDAIDFAVNDCENKSKRECHV